MTLKGHKYGVRNFEMANNILVSIGDENDKGMIVWDLKDEKILSANMMKNSNLQSIAFLE